METPKNICTATNPFGTKAEDCRTEWEHPDSSLVYSGATYDEFKCHHCGIKFWIRKDKKQI